MPTRSYRCPRCGRGLVTPNEKHASRGMSCRERARCPACRNVAYVNADGRMASHKAWSGVKVEACPGVGKPPRNPDHAYGAAPRPKA